MLATRPLALVTQVLASVAWGLVTQVLKLVILWLALVFLELEMKALLHHRRRTRC